MVICPIMHSPTVHLFQGFPQYPGLLCSSGWYFPRHEAYKSMIRAGSKKQKKDNFASLCFLLHPLLVVFVFSIFICLYDFHSFLCLNYLPLFF